MVTILTVSQQHGFHRYCRTHWEHMEIRRLGELLPEDGHRLGYLSRQAQGKCEVRAYALERSTTNSVNLRELTVARTQC